MVNDDKKTVIFGYPGTGKTTTLMNYLDTLLNDGIKATEICLCSFSKSAAENFRTRAMMNGVDKKDMDYFGTIHSICFRQFCMNRKVVQPKYLSIFFKRMMIGFREEITFDEDTLVMSADFEELGNKILTFYNNLRIRLCKDITQIKDNEELKEDFHKMKLSDELFSDMFIGLNAHYVLREYEKFKVEYQMVDFVDMLLLAYRSKWVIPTRILMVDESQDLSPLQWAIYDLWCQNKDKIIIAGDDDQSIYMFNGADPARLLKEKENAAEVIVLNTTYRLCQKIHEHCKQFIDQNIPEGKRVYKDVVAIKPGGEVKEVDAYHQMEIVLKEIRPNRKTFIQFRTNAYKRAFINEVLIPNGIPFNEIKGMGIWSNKLVHIFNAIIKLQNKTPINKTELEYLMDSISAEYKLMKRGLKTNFTQMEKQESYTLEDMLKLGFNMIIFNYLKDYMLLEVMNLTETQERVIRAMEPKILNLPILISIGTMHAAKGLEAEDNIVFRDISPKVVKEIKKDDLSWESEIRVHFVGRSRGGERLVIINNAFKYAEPDVIP